MPQTAFAFLIGCAAISALPPLNGFVSEWQTFQAILVSPRRPSALPGRRQASPKSKIASPLVHRRMRPETDNQHPTEK
jgi:hypothetical protein